jgi:ABC-type polysaccharide/polyol phosphate export permease
MTKPTWYIDANQSPWSFRQLFIEPIKELLKFKELIRNLVIRDLKVRYKRSYLGIAWSVLAPLLTMLTMWVVFKVAMRIQIPNYASFLFAGLTVWQFFANTSKTASTSILQAAPMIKKVRMPKAIFPLTIAMNNLINFVFCFIALLIIISLSEGVLNSTLLLTPLVLIPVLLFSMGWGLLAATLTVYFRDVVYLLEVILGGWFYVTPILYSAEMIPEKYNWALSLNPMAKFVFLFQEITYYGHVPPLKAYLTSLVVGLFMFIFGWIIFHRYQRNFIYWL